MFENAKAAGQEDGEIDPRIATIVGLIQEKMAMRDRLSNDTRFEPAVKDRLMTDLQNEINALNDEKTAALEARKATLSGEPAQKELTDEDVADILERAHQQGL